MKKTIKYFMIGIAVMISSPKLFAQISIGISVHINPPALPVYSQPACPVEGYLWVPGYWAWSGDANDFYWVPGVWVSPPQPGLLWTPGYWGYEGDLYVFHRGYWGRHIGFYGGVNYGYGYSGSGFYGGRWEGNSFRYNTAVVNVNNTVVHNTYIDRTVIVNNTTVNNVSYNGPGGVTAKPRPEEVRAMNESHIQPTVQQQSHEKVAQNNPAQFAKANNGRPATTSMNKVNGRQFNGEGSNARAMSASDKAAAAPHNAQAADAAGNTNNRPLNGQAQRTRQPAGSVVNNRAARPFGQVKANAPATHNRMPAQRKPVQRQQERPVEKPRE
ncbi:YXWGXW repeat-containing protein [Mucilaginibacter xinganensis]|uniref:YXWGXW repeat-containing protein n=1 Tax=Mucilaginibacter xinganensis TaxID=1234841 RepID=A0A223NQJ3_9SPHI|nr:YXWGXW repeat-containing protein [Mucilaginibacter xinganensis]ASU32179.1 YXWGXW repeat-containing protein [Mucilaginibacter xinganensis]